jgi:hypothetical protein
VCAYVDGAPFFDAMLELDRPLTVGRDRAARLRVPARDRFEWPLLEPLGALAALRIDAAMDGVVVETGPDGRARSLPLAAARRALDRPVSAVPDVAAAIADGSYLLPLARRAHGRVRLCPRVVVHFSVRPPKDAPAPRLPREVRGGLSRALEPGISLTLGLSLALHALGGVACATAAMAPAAAPPPVTAPVLGGGRTAR